MDTRYAQIVIGAPGAGKSTYCDGMQMFLSSIGRPVAVVNLDPANHITSYPCAVDIRHLITVEDAMSKHNLGPNGGWLRVVVTNYTAFCAWKDVVLVTLSFDCSFHFLHGVSGNQLRVALWTTGKVTWSEQTLDYKVIVEQFAWLCSDLMNACLSWSACDCVRRQISVLPHKCNACKYLPGKYIIFDCPGQVELFTHHKSIATITKALLSRNWRVCIARI